MKINITPPECRKNQDLKRQACHLAKIIGDYYKLIADLSHRFFFHFTTAVRCFANILSNTHRKNLAFLSIFIVQHILIMCRADKVVSHFWQRIKFKLKTTNHSYSFRNDYIKSVKNCRN
jgi:hypothetical protein